MQEKIVFKGNRYGLRLLLDNTVSYEEIFKLLKNKLKQSSNFFQEGTVIVLDTDWLDCKQIKEITKLFEDYGLVLTQVEVAQKKENIKQNNQQIHINYNEKEIKKVELKGNEISSMIINQTIRNGQEVISEGSIIINGNVNPGATIIARGNIKVYGTCRGIVHAGAFGDLSAFVMANHLIPIQIRIGNLVARAPQTNMTKNDAPCPEKAYIENGKIILKAINGEIDNE